MSSLSARSSRCSSRRSSSAGASRGDRQRSISSASFELESSAGRSSCSTLPDPTARMGSIPDGVMDSSAKLALDSICTACAGSGLLHTCKPTTKKGKRAKTGSAKHVPRPMNAFMIWARETRRMIAETNPKMHNAQISKQLGQMWESVPENKKNGYRELAAQVKRKHEETYPDYKYRPQKKVAKALPPCVNTKPQNRADESSSLARKRGGKNTTGSAKTAIAAAKRRKKTVVCHLGKTPLSSQSRSEATSARPVSSKPVSKRQWLKSAKTRRQVDEDDDDDEEEQSDAPDSDAESSSDSDAAPSTPSSESGGEEGVPSFSSAKPEFSSSSRDGLKLTLTRQSDTAWNSGLTPPAESKNSFNFDDLPAFSGLNGAHGFEDLMAGSFSSDMERSFTSARAFAGTDDIRLSLKAFDDVISASDDLFPGNSLSSDWSIPTSYDYSNYELFDPPMPDVIC